MKKLTTISDVRLFFHRNERPIYFISATNFNLAGLDERVQHFKHINYIDCFDGRHPNVFVPKEMPHEEFESIEDINNYLLEHKAVIDYIKGRGGKPVAQWLPVEVREIGDVDHPGAVRHAAPGRRDADARGDGRGFVPGPGILQELAGSVCKVGDQPVEGFLAAGRNLRPGDDFAAPHQPKLGCRAADVDANGHRGGNDGVLTSAPR